MYLLGMTFEILDFSHCIEHSVASLVHVLYNFRDRILFLVTIALKLRHLPVRLNYLLHSDFFYGCVTKDADSQKDLNRKVIILS